MAALRGYQAHDHEELDLHSFLIDKHGNLVDTWARIPAIRRHIESLPKTASAFKLRHVSGLEISSVPLIHIEFLGSWRVKSSNFNGDTLYVNPNYMYVENYADISVECDCGAIITHTSGNEADLPDINAEHNSGCLSYDKLRARANLEEKRYTEIKRLTWLGWKGEQIANRLGLGQTTIYDIVRDHGLSIKDLHNEYRKTAGRTYNYIVHELGHPAKRVEAIYDHDKATLSRWSNIDD